MTTLLLIMNAFAGLEAALGSATGLVNNPPATNGTTEKR